MKPARSLLASLALVLPLSLTSVAGAQPGVVDHSQARASFALIGDVPYGVGEEPKFERVIDAINRSTSVRFVLHTGDVKQGSERCDDAVFARRYAQFQRFAVGFVMTPGDNDWTDCHRTNNGGYLPTERLMRFRQVFYPQFGLSTGGRPFAVTTQAADPAWGEFVEHQMWRFAGTTMATLHVVGSNNGLDPWNQIDASDSYITPRADRLAEFSRREAAALAWIDSVFDAAVAANSAGVMIAMQANPAFELSPAAQQRQGFNRVLDKLGARAQAFGRPVLLAHGDSHYFRLDKPLVRPVAGGGSAMLENFTRVENFGSPSVHWVEIAVDARDPGVFQVIPRIVAGNVFPR
jgi:hypothetical protein